MVLSWARLKKCCLEVPALLKKYLFVFIAMHLVNLFFTQIMIYLQELRMTSKDDIYIPIMLVLALVGFIAQSIIRTAWTFVICHFFKSRSSLQEFLRHHLEQGLIESLRAFFRAVLWGFVFIFPGFHKYFQYQFVLYIVGLDENYDAGRTDALAESTRLTKGHLTAVSVVQILFALTGLITSTGYFIFDKPIQVLLTESVGLILILLETLYFMHLYQDLRAEKAQSVSAL